MTASEEKHLPEHVAIIMDGNNRFAKKNQMQKGEGHREGKNVLDPIVECCVEQGVKALTVFAFSSENWNRPQFEVELLMSLLEETIHDQMPRMEKFDICLRFIGDRSRLPAHLRELMLQAEQRTANFSTMTLVIAVSYGGMWDIAEAAKQIAQDAVNQKIQIEDINVDLFGQYASLGDLPPVDLLIRTGGDYRLSNFLLWQAAYAELYFTPTLWPEFTVNEFNHALNIFNSRERRFGKTSEQIQQKKLEN
ncbi:polyprenyl diphosphate synthase [Acinetobacter radioresistens]|jgi:undecaprenyl diphosphate synthase|uniref:Ditrans,polycis-undecaprenyl-diphosphate synthase ((2E,6E)-farnesyl-diphosphate specific) n=2 Tax=Acinetobacter radioresistens TaxID=40216 RepID=A0A2T1IXU4_ACIRA|nr:MULTISPECIES: polyprenyl diphosphate synthase [Acinetobacter]EET81650.1 di-trans,poly-cis-decaprenylcistransferase [Acinetobacter radioresistens SK82]EEY87535.1 di-trans,poly-cis-decaprenylcistransferase [Acinetobacter radioresistens SH164]EJO37306.1 di-trans,poly-cis-decaprenylcistransferase [Acinetobacter radioresistens WC-A-157]ENV87859.1 undecaprenyl pyrophosphate synthase [Acinetobacter radioresistens NIPH 2130]ENV88908.1 undecaprenyl pyrophosphate synthase [Acinetobacter radioresisten